MCPKIPFLTGKLTNRQNDNGAAMIVWLHGGRLTMGWKDDQYDPSRLMAQGVLQTGKEVIIVALNSWVSLPS